MSALPPTAIKLVRRNEVTLCAKPDPLATLSNRFGLLIVWLPLGGQHETSPQAISTFGCRCRRPSGCVADRRGAVLSDATRAHRGRLSARPSRGHQRPPAGAMAVGA